MKQVNSIQDFLHSPPYRQLRILSWKKVIKLTRTNLSKLYSYIGGLLAVHQNKITKTLIFFYFNQAPNNVRRYRTKDTNMKKWFQEKIKLNLHRMPVCSISRSSLPARMRWFGYRGKCSTRARCPEERRPREKRWGECRKQPSTTRS
jgi:hypothetical protein